MDVKSTGTIFGFPKFSESSILLVLLIQLIETIQTSIIWSTKSFKISLELLIFAFFFVDFSGFSKIHNS